MMKEKYASFFPTIPDECMHPLSASIHGLDYQLICIPGGERKHL